MRGMGRGDKFVKDHGCRAEFGLSPALDGSRVGRVVVIDCF